MLTFRDRPLVRRALAYVGAYLAVLGVVLTAFAIVASAPKLATEHSGLAAWSVVVASTLVLGCVCAVLLRRHEILEATLADERKELAGKDERMNQLSAELAGLDHVLANERRESAKLSARLEGLDDVLADERRESARKDERMNQLSARLAGPTDNDIELFNRYQRDLHPDAGLIGTLRHITIPGMPKEWRELEGSDAKEIFGIPIDFGAYPFINDEVEECRLRFIEVAGHFAATWVSSYPWGEDIEEPWPEVTVDVTRDSPWFELVQGIVEAHTTMFRTALRNNLTRGKPLEEPRPGE